MPKNYKLTYFNSRGRAEPMRLIFAYKGVQYEDKRVTQEEWQKIKPEMPTHQLPVLEVDGEKLPQSIAIARYLGNEFGLAGKTNWENAKLDAVVGCMEDFSADLSRWYREQDPQKKQQIQQDLKDNIMPAKLAAVESCAGLNKEGNNKFILGGQPTWADFFTGAMLDFVNTIVYQGQLAQANKNLADYRDRVMSLPGVKEWIAERPDTPM